MIKELLLTFYRNTAQKPTRMLFYRDGVSEGQLQEVLYHESQAIWRACSSLEENYSPLLTYVVVQKRHHARFFPRNDKEADKSGNTMPGTIIETGVTHPIEFDFYLCSHAGLQGTSRPTY